MQKQISIQIHRLLDTDYVEGVPYVQVKPEAGVDWSADTKAHKSTGTGIRKKDDTFEWDADVSECTLTFNLDEDNDVNAFVAVVNVYFDNAEGVSRYDGVGKLEMLDGDSADNAICTLYDNGDEDLPSFGEIIFSYQVLDVDEQGEAIVEDEGNVVEDDSGRGLLHDDDPTHWTEEFDDVHQCNYYYNHAKLESTWERPPCLDAPLAFSGQSTLATATTATKSPQARAQAGNDNYDGTAGNTTTDFSSSIPFGMNTTGSDLSATLRTGSNHTSQTHNQSLRRPPDGTDDEVSVTESKHTGNVSPPAKKKMRKKTPEWAKFNDYSSELNLLLKKSVADVKPDVCNFGIRVHSMMCSNTHESLDLEAVEGVTSGQLKLSIQPYPGKGHVLKTKICDVDSEGMLNFDFSLQTVNLSMGAADLKSKAFLNGVCPHVLVEFSCMGSVTKGCLFLPEVLNIEESRLVWVNMLPQEEKNADGSSRVNMDTRLKSTLILEVVKTSNKQNTTTTVTSGSITSPGASKKNLHLNMAGVSAASVSVDIGGIAARSKLKLNYDQCVLEASLSCSGQHGVFPMSSKSAFKEGVTINTKFSFISEFPKLDILFLKIFEVLDVTTHLLGSIEIPVFSLLSSNPDGGNADADASSLSGPFKTFSVERPPQSKTGVVVNKVNLNEWALFCTVHCAVLDEDGGRDSPINQFLGHTALTTLDENEELMDSFEPRHKVENNHLEKRQFETVNSVDGSLHVCVHGFIPKQGSTGPSLGKSDLLSVEFSLPNSMQPLKEKTEVVRVCVYPEGEKEQGQASLCSLWDKEFSFPVVWAVQQRHVGFLQGSVYRSSPSNEKTKGTGSEGSKMRRQLLGYVTLDIASMVNLHGDAIVCTLPVTSRVCGDEDYQTGSGHVMLGLQFTDRNAPPDGPSSVPFPQHITSSGGGGAGAGGGLKLKPVSRPPLQQSRQQAWGGDMDIDAQQQPNQTPHPSKGGRGKINQQMSPLPLPASAFSGVKKACMDRWPQFCHDVIAGYAKLCDNDNISDVEDEDTPLSQEISGVSVSLSSIEVVTGPLRHIDDEEQILFHLSSNEKAVSSNGAIDLDTGKISLEASDLTMPVNMKSNTSILLMMKLTKVEDDEVLGVASLVLPRKLVITGKPMNIAVPLRDSSGVKIAVVICGLHFSSLGMTALEEPREESETGSQLEVCVVEGNINDSVWTSSLEPYFECSLTKAVHQGPSPPSSSHSGGFNSSSCVETASVDIQATGPWNATCNVPLPREAIVDPITTKQGATPLWSLQVVCRDAARRECPEISRTQMNIPWSLLSAGRPVEQWVNMIPAANGTSLITEPEDFDDDEEEGKEWMGRAPPTTRLRIQISKVNIADKDKHAHFQGVGHIVMWFHSIREGENHSEKVFPAVDILAAEARVQSIDRRNDYYEDDSNMDSTFSNIHIETRQSIFVANKTADVLSGSVAIPGGHSLTHLRLTTRHEKVALLASMPTLATLPKPTLDSSLSLDVPLHEAVLRPNVNENFTTGALRQRMSRLKVGAVYVPYVVGVLHVEHSHLELFDTVAEKFQMSPVKNGALRYSLGGVGSCFTSGFSMSVHEDGTTTVCSSVGGGGGGGGGSVISQLSNYPGQPKVPRGGKKSSSFKRPGNGTTKNKSKNKNKKTPPTAKATNKLRSMVAANKEEIRDPQYIFVDTFELLSQAAKGKSSVADIFDLTVNLIDLDARGTEYCMGSGQIKTAPLYFQALRMLLSVPQNTNTNTNSGDTASDIPSTLATEVKIFDKSRRTLIGTVHITLKFDITSIPLPIINALKNFKNVLFAAPSTGGVSGLEGLGRAELGLKQAYQLADKDQSGGINMNELTEVLESISSMRRKKSNSKEVVGLDDGAIALLVGLMGLVNGAKANGDVDYNHDEIIKLFQVMDLDGDGNVSWWEWRQVLEGGFAVMQMNSEQQRLHQQQGQQLAGGSGSGTDISQHCHIYPLDPLLVTLEAVHASLMVKYGGIIHKRRDLPHSRPPISSSNSAGVQLSSSDKLKDKIAKMKAKNTRLQLKLEAANNTSNEVLSPQRGGADSDVFRSVRAEEQAKQARDLLEIERKRRTELEIELEKMHHTTNEVSRSRSIQNSSNHHSLQQLHAESDRLRQEMVVANMSRRQIDRSSLIIQRFFFLIHKKYLERKEVEDRNRVTNGMESLVLRRRYKNKQAERANHATKIQCLFRKYAARKRMRILWKAVYKIHELCLLRKMRKAAGREREILQEKLMIKRLEAEARERQRLEEEEAERLRLETEKQNAAAVSIQARYRGNAHRQSVLLSSSDNLLDEASAMDDDDFGQNLDELSLSKDEVLADDQSLFPDLGTVFTNEKDDPNAVMILRSVPQPAMDQVVGYWVSHPREANHPRQKDESGTDTEREAQVEEIDLDTLRMRVMYPLEEPSTEAFFQYDDPTLTWLKACSEKEIKLEIKATTQIQAAFRGRQSRQRLKPIQNARREKKAEEKRVVDEKNASTKIQAAFRGRQGRKAADDQKRAALDDDTVMTDGLDVVDRPPLSEACGYWVKIPHDHQEGLVDTVDPASGAMKVMYDIDEDGDGITDVSEEREVDYAYPDLIWLKEREDKEEEEEEEEEEEREEAEVRSEHEQKEDDQSVASVMTDGLDVVDRPPISEACGHWVKIPHDHQEGLVDTVDPASGAMKVMYDIDEDGDGITDVSEEREVDYANPDLIWLKEREEKVEEIDTSLAGSFNPDIDDDDDEDAFTVVDKPSIETAAGCWIKIGASGEEGLVDRIDVATGVMQILYDTESVSGDHAKHLEEEYSNPAIIWLKEREDKHADNKEEIDTLLQNDGNEDEDEDAFTVVDKPSIEAAAGCWIKIGASGEEGLVDRIDIATGVMQILYDTDSVSGDNAKHFEEEYSNPAIIWLKERD